jgi:hypothetical protein
MSPPYIGLDGLVMKSKITIENSLSPTHFSMQKQTIFYSWQSDLPNSTNRGFIQDRLEEAIAELKSTETLKVDPVLDRDTAGVPGSPDIGLTIFSKIEKAAVFVCDVSIINSGAEERPCPNPNVMIELGFALRTLGASRILMVMNTAYGGPERLPFDLRQKRVATYELCSGGNKDTAKKTLKTNFVTAIGAVLNELDSSSGESDQSDLVAVVIDAVSGSKPNFKRALRSYMLWLVAELDQINSERSDEIEDEKLVQDLTRSIPLVKTFDSIANVIAAYDAKDAAVDLAKDFEFLIRKYRPAKGFSGTWRTIDFDFYKFFGHELFVILAAYLVKDERWETLGEVLRTRIHMDNHPSGRHETVKFSSLSDHLALLDEVRRSRLIVDNRKRTSIHADLLKERHENLPLAENLTWEEFLEADHFLCLYSLMNSTEDWCDKWWPRSWVYFGDRSPRFILDAYTANGAITLATAFGTNNVDELKTKLAGAIEQYQKGIRSSSSGFAFDPYWRFDIERIGSDK